MSDTHVNRRTNLIARSRSVLAGSPDASEHQIAAALTDCIAERLTVAVEIERTSRQQSQLLDSALADPPGSAVLIELTDRLKELRSSWQALSEVSEGLRARLESIREESVESAAPWP